MEQLFAVLAVFGLMAIAFLVLRRRGLASFSRLPGRRRPAAALEVIDKVILTPQHTLHLVRVGGEVILIGAGPGGCSRLARMDVSDVGRTLQEQL